MADTKKVFAMADIKKEFAAAHDAPLVSSYNDQIRPMLDTVDRLRHLNIMQEGIQLATIVVVGDQSSGKSSVLESLAGISLPRGQGICTRVPLVMRLQNHKSPHPQFLLEFGGKTLSTDEARIVDDIVLATMEIAGKGKGISNNPLTLIVRKNGVPDLTMVDLPGITRVPVRGQPEDIYKQISKIITEYITPKESIILNVLSASVDFSTCESIRMSQRVDKMGQRTLAVVTKADKSPEGLPEKVTADDVNIGLGYVCVRNRIGEESYEEAREKEALLFETHPQLSKINKSIIGIPVLAERLMKIQATIIVKCLPEIVGKINDKLSTNIEELNRLPQSLSSIAEAMASFVNILDSATKSLRKILLEGGENDTYPDIHSTPNLGEMLSKYSMEVKSSYDSNNSFLRDEIMALEETKVIGLPNFISKSAFLNLLEKKVKSISSIPFHCVDKIWRYVENVVISVLLRHCENYPQLTSCTRRAATNVIARKKQESLNWVKHLVEMEKLIDYTCNPEYTVSFNKLMVHQDEFMKKVNSPSSSRMTIRRFGEIQISHLHQKGFVQEAFDLKMRMTAYWDIVLMRMKDNLTLHILYSIQNLVNKEMQSGVINEIIGQEGGGLKRMLEETRSTSEKRKKLKSSINLLKESKDVVANIIDRVNDD